MSKVNTNSKLQYVLTKIEDWGFVLDHAIKKDNFNALHKNSVSVKEGIEAYEKGKHVEFNYVLTDDIKIKVTGINNPFIGYGDFGVNVSKGKNEKTPWFFERGSIDDLNKCLEQIRKEFDF